MRVGVCVGLGGTAAVRRIGDVTEGVIEVLASIGVCTTTGDTGDAGETEVVFRSQALNAPRKSINTIRFHFLFITFSLNWIGFSKPLASSCPRLKIFQT